MVASINNTQTSKDVMNSEIPQEITLPTHFGKCLNLLSTDSRNLQINKKPAQPRVESRGEILIPYAQDQFELKGSLKVDDHGFLYVDLNNHFIYDLFERLDCPGAELPPYFTSQKSYGAHITVALTSEEFDTSQIPHLGEEITFSITGCYWVNLESWEGIKRVWFLTVDAPMLSTIRTELGLSPKLMDHEFHITFAVEKQFLALDDFLTVAPNKAIEIDHEKAQKRKVRQMQRALSENKA